jgi:hypothetical protein
VGTRGVYCVLASVTEHWYFTESHGCKGGWLHVQLPQFFFQKQLSGPHLELLLSADFGISSRVDDCFPPIDGISCITCEQ